MIGFNTTNNNPLLYMCDSGWDADNPNNNTGSIPVDGTALASVTDVCRKGNTFAQATGAAQPILKTNIINGHNVFRFSGAQFMTCAGATANNYTGAMTIIVLGMTTSAAVTARIFGKVDATTGFSAGQNNDQYQFTARGVSDYNSDAGQWVANTFQMGAYVYNGSNSVSFYKNGVLDKAVSGSAVPSSTATVYLGTFTGTTQFWNGDMQSIWWKQGSMTAGEISFIWQTFAKPRLGL